MHYIEVAVFCQGKVGKSMERIYRSIDFKMSDL